MTIFDGKTEKNGLFKDSVKQSLPKVTWVLCMPDMSSVFGK